MQEMVWALSSRSKTCLLYELRSFEKFKRRKPQEEPRKDKNIKIHGRTP